MYIIAVDDNRKDLFTLKKEIRKVAPDCMLSCFTKPKDALKYAELCDIDVAFIEPDMGNGTGIILAKKLKDIYGRMNIVFVAKSKHYANDTYSVCASGYCIKPIVAEQVSKELEEPRYPIVERRGQKYEPLFTIKTEDKEITVAFSTIISIRYDKRTVTYDVDDLELLYDKVLPWRFGKIIAPLLEDKRFLRATKNCVINMDWIDKVTDNSLVVFSEEINIPHADYGKIKEKYNDYCLLRVQQGTHGGYSKAN